MLPRRCRGIRRIHCGETHGSFELSLTVVASRPGSHRLEARMTSACLLCRHSGFIGFVTRDSYDLCGPSIVTSPGIDHGTVFFGLFVTRVRKSSFKKCSFIGLSFAFTTSRRSRTTPQKRASIVVRLPATGKHCIHQCDGHVGKLRPSFHLTYTMGATHAHLHHGCNSRSTARN